MSRRRCSSVLLSKQRSVNRLCLKRFHTCSVTPSGARAFGMAAFALSSRIILLSLAQANFRMCFLIAACFFLLALGLVSAVFQPILLLLLGGLT